MKKHECKAKRFSETYFQISIKYIFPLLFLTEQTEETGENKPAEEQPAEDAPPATED